MLKHVHLSPYRNSMMNHGSGTTTTSNSSAGGRSDTLSLNSTMSCSSSLSNQDPLSSRSSSYTSLNESHHHIQHHHHLQQQTPQPQPMVNINIPMSSFISRLTSGAARSLAPSIRSQREEGGAPLERECGLDCIFCREKRWKCYDESPHQQKGFWQRSESDDERSASQSIYNYHLPLGKRIKKWAEIKREHAYRSRLYISLWNVKGASRAASSHFYFFFFRQVRRAKVKYILNNFQDLDRESTWPHVIIVTHLSFHLEKAKDISLILFCLDLFFLSSCKNNL